MQRERPRRRAPSTISAPRLALAVCVCSVACTVERADVRTPSGEPPEADTTRIRANLAAIASAYQTGDLSALDTIYHDSVSVFEGGHIVRGWASYRDRQLARKFEELSDRRLQFGDIRVNLSGGTAWVTCRYQLDGTQEGRVVTDSGILTLVLRKTQGRWQIVHIHSSGSPQGRGAGGPQTGI